jgi:TonB family protein
MATRRSNKRFARHPAHTDNPQNLLIIILLIAASLVSVQAANQEKSTRRWRIAFIGFTESSENKIAQDFLEKLALDERASLIDESQIKLALSGLGYKESLNLSVEEARRTGAAIGCDFFIIGKTDAALRSETANESHGESIIGLMLVDSRSGKLAHFDFILEKAATIEAAQAKARQTLASRVNIYLEKMSEFRTARESIIPVSTELVEDMPDAESAATAGFKAPEFINRMKPEYTEEATHADITATVEANVIFKADGEIGDIELIRWAGFGLDESAVRAIHQLKFKPATRNNKAIPVRALIRYNFRRVSEVDAQQKPQAPEPKPEEKTQRDLRQLFKPQVPIPRKPDH